MKPEGGIGLTLSIQKTGSNHAVNGRMPLNSGVTLKLNRVFGMKHLSSTTGFRIERYP